MVGIPSPVDYTGYCQYIFNTLWRRLRIFFIWEFLVSRRKEKNSVKLSSSFKKSSQINFFQPWLSPAQRSTASTLYQTYPLRVRCHNVYNMQLDGRDSCTKSIKNHEAHEITVLEINAELERFQLELNAGLLFCSNNQPSFLNVV